MLFYEEVRVVDRDLAGSRLSKSNREDSFQQKLTIKGGCVAIDRHMQSGLQLDSPAFPAVRLVCFGRRFFPHKFPPQHRNTGLLSKPSPQHALGSRLSHGQTSWSINSGLSVDIFYKM